MLSQGYSLGGLKETKMFLPYPRVKVSIVGRLRDREVACSASDRQGSNFESCVWRTVSSLSSHHPQEVLLVQFSLGPICAQRWPKARFILFYKATFTPPDGRCYHTQYMTTPYRPYCHFTADCNRISDQTPNKHETSSQCKFNAGPPAATLAQY